MTRFAKLLVLGLLTAACSAEEPEATAVAPADAPARAQAPAAAEPEAAGGSAEEALRLAQATDQATEQAAEAPAESRSQPSEQPAAPPPASSRFREGQHYRVLTPAQPTNVSPGKVEVAEVFWYGCPHCYSLEPYIQRWQANAPPQAELVRVAASLNPSWQPHARLFYASKTLGVLDRAHAAAFRELHVNRNPLNTLDAQVEFLSQFGVSEQAARDTLTSFPVETEMRRADLLVRRYRLTGVPAIVVNGKYVAGVDTAGGPDALMELVNYLVALESGSAG
jgi:thiol:disulfide interchange protein DsbA